MRMVEIIINTLANKMLQRIRTEISLFQLSSIFRNGETELRRYNEIHYLQFMILNTYMSNVYVTVNMNFW